MLWNYSYKFYNLNINKQQYYIYKPYLKNIYKSLLKKIWLKQDFGKEHRYFYILSKDLTKLEETFAKNLNDVENSSTELKKDLKNLLLDSVKEVEVFSAK